MEASRTFLLFPQFDVTLLYRKTLDEVASKLHRVIRDSFGPELHTLINPFPKTNLTISPEG